MGIRKRNWPAVLPTIVETIAQTLRLPYVAIAVHTDDRRPTTDNNASSVVSRRSSPRMETRRSACHPVSIQGHNDDSVFAALRADARGYVLKDTDEDEMMRAIRAVAGGEAIFSPAIATRLIDFFAAARPAAPKAVFPELTEREREILSLIAQGESNAEIAARLALSLKTVRNHVSNIFSKLQVADRVQAAIRARAAGLGDPS